MMFNSSILYMFHAGNVPNMLTVGLNVRPQLENMLSLAKKMFHTEVS